MLSCAFTYYPEKLEPGRFNIIATSRENAAILWKDGEYFVVSVRNPSCAELISETRAFSIDAHGYYVHPEPIPLKDLSEWQKRAGEVTISLGTQPMRPLER